MGRNNEYPGGVERCLQGKNDENILHGCEQAAQIESCIIWGHSKLLGKWMWIDIKQTIDCRLLSQARLQ